LQWIYIKQNSMTKLKKKGWKKIYLKFRQKTVKEQCFDCCSSSHTHCEKLQWVYLIPQSECEPASNQQMSGYPQ